MPDWLETFRIVGTIAVWVILPVQVWSTWRSLRQFRKWEADEKGRIERWTLDLAEAAQMKAEAAQLRAQAEAKLRQARSAK